LMLPFVSATDDRSATAAPAFPKASVDEERFFAMVHVYVAVYTMSIQ
jgi:hypothetical protein